jgi:hypothetical protein
MMTTTPFFAPTTVSQVQTFDSINQLNTIPWQNLDSIADASSWASTTKPLHTISGLWMEKFLSKTNQLWLTGFDFSGSGLLTGIEFRLAIQRAARIEDFVIQLTLNGELIGDNQASTVNPVESNMYTGDYMASPIPPQPVGDFNIYGGSSDLWGTTLSSTDIQDPTFGIVISFKSNEIYPHTDLCYVNQVALRVSYA